MISLLWRDDHDTCKKNLKQSFISRLPWGILKYKGPQNKCVVGLSVPYSDLCLERPPSNGYCIPQAVGFILHRMSATQRVSIPRIRDGHELARTPTLASRKTLKVSFLIVTTSPGLQWRVCPFSQSQTGEFHLQDSYCRH